MQWIDFKKPHTRGPTARRDRYREVVASESGLPRLEHYFKSSTKSLQFSKKETDPYLKPEADSKV
jgi:hypothetical protein